MARGVGPRRPASTGRQERSGDAGASVRPAGAGPADSRGRPGRVLGKSGRAKALVAASSVSKSSVKRSISKASGSKCGYDPLAPGRIADILGRLDQLYPDVTCALHHKSAWELVVATILSAQSTDVNVNRVTPELFRKYPTVEAFAAITPEQLQPDIYSTGFFRNKAKSVVGAARKIVSEFGGQVPDEMDKLLTLPGVARKTANVVLGSWFGKGVGVVVDTHVTRISRRLELTKSTDAPKIEQDLMRIIPQNKWILFSHQIIWHGRKLCIARRPKCADCALESLCHAADKTWTTVEIHQDAKP